MSTIPASVYIICCNEEAHIGRALESVKDFDEIVVVDSGSTDGTLEIVRRYTDKLIHNDWPGFAAQKAFALAQCRNDWVLNIDADEQISPELEREIRDTIQADDMDALDIRISSRYMGRFNAGWCRFNRRLRFFRRSKAHYIERLVHESVAVDGRIRQADGFIYDYGSDDLQTHLSKINTYSSLRAQEKINAGRRPSLLKLLLAFPISFIKSYLIKRALLNGLPGFIASVNNAFYAFLKEAKLFELARRRRDGLH